MIFVAELQMQGNKHVHVNSGLLQILQQAFKNQSFKMFCDETHQNELSKYSYNLELIEFESFEYTGVKELKKSQTLNKLIRECILAVRIFKKAQKNNVPVIIFASAFPFTSLFLNYLSRRFKQKIIICLHGDIGVLTLKQKKLTTIIFRQSIKLFFEYRNPNTIVLFYGEPVKNKLFQLFFTFDNRNVISIDHPYNYDDDQDGNTIINNNIVTIANIGTGLINKNSHLLYKLALLQKNNIIGGLVHFLQIGNISAKVLNYSNRYVDIVNLNKFIPFDFFEKNVKIANYFVYFFSENSYYDLCPSGTFFDAIKYKKPIIALHNLFFDYYFKKLGNIGYLCDSVEEMSDRIEQILKGDVTNEYMEQVNALTRASKLLSIEQIAKDFQQQYELIR